MKPFFVYGTLKPHKERWPQIQEHVKEVRENTFVQGVIFYIGGGGFPGLYLDDRQEDKKVFGVLVYPHEEDYNELVERLDWIEGVARGLFSRVETAVFDVETGEQICEAYTYVYNPIVGGEW